MKKIVGLLIILLLFWGIIGCSDEVENDSTNITIPTTNTTIPTTNTTIPTTNTTIPTTNTTIPTTSTTIPTNSNSITVYMEKPLGWSNVYVYIWDDSGKEYVGEWPGIPLTLQGGFYYYNVSDAENGYINIVFNDGNNNQQTFDIFGVNQNMYFKSVGVFSGDNKYILLQANTSPNFPPRIFKATDQQENTITLGWDLIPDADGYVLYDLFEYYDNDDNYIGNFWHLQKILTTSETSLYDDNYGQYIDPNTTYSWKLLAIKWKGNVDLSEIDNLDDMKEDDFSDNYTVVHDFGSLNVSTLPSSKPGPTGLKVKNVESKSVELSWDPVALANHYMVWWWNDDDDEWQYIEEAYDTNYIDADEEFIFPNSSYRYYVDARFENNIISKSSNVVTAYTTAYSGNINGDLGGIAPSFAISKVPLSTPSAPKVTTNPAAYTIEVSWDPANTKNYKIGIFTSSSSPSPLKTQSVSVSNAFKPVKVTVPTTQHAYVVKLMAVADSVTKSDSGWSQGTTAVVFPKINYSTSKTTTKNYKIVNVTSSVTWKLGAGMSYEYYWTALDRNTSVILGNGYSSNTKSFPVTVYTAKQFSLVIRPSIYANGSLYFGDNKVIGTY